jgi:hypothetical protein
VKKLLPYDICINLFVKKFLECTAKNYKGAKRRLSRNQNRIST